MWICVSLFFCLFPRMQSANKFLVRGILVNTCERVSSISPRNMLNFTAVWSTPIFAERNAICMIRKAVLKNASR